MGAKADYTGVDQMIENKLLQCCKNKGIKRNEMVRQLFCIQLDIKEGYEVVQTSDLIKTDSYTAAELAVLPVSSQKV